MARMGVYIFRLVPCIGDEKIIAVRPADILNPVWEKAKEEVAGLKKVTRMIFSKITSNEDVGEELIKDDIKMPKQPVGKLRPDQLVGAMMK